MNRRGTNPPDGFLVELSAAQKRKIREAPRGRMFAFCEEMNRYGMKVLLELPAQRSRPAEAYGLLFYLKALTSFQGALLLLSRGMAVESEALSRVGLECAFELGAIAADPDHIALLKSAHDVHEGSMARSLKELVGGQLGEHFGPELAKWMEKATGLPKQAKYNLAATAAKGGLQASYETFYRSTSGAAAHATLAAVARHLREEGGMLRVHIGPDYDQFPQAFAIAAHFLPLCFRSVGQIFAKSDLAEAAGRFDTEWGEIIRPFEQLVRR